MGEGGLCHTLKKHVEKTCRKATVIENHSRKKSKVDFKNTQICKTLTFVGHSYPYDDLEFHLTLLLLYHVISMLCGVHYL